MDISQRENYSDLLDVMSEKANEDRRAFRLSDNKKHSNILYTKMWLNVCELVGKECERRLISNDTGCKISSLVFDAIKDDMIEFKNNEQNLETVNVYIDLLTAESQKHQ